LKCDRFKTAYCCEIIRLILLNTLSIFQNIFEMLIARRETIGLCTFFTLVCENLKNATEAESINLINGSGTLKLGKSVRV
jgi:hypothetical protein